MLFLFFLFSMHFLSLQPDLNGVLGRCSSRSIAGEKDGKEGAEGVTVGWVGEG